MKALTLHQPWASLISLGVKTIETRSWSTKYRGPLLIHAGKREPLSGYQYGDFVVPGLKMFHGGETVDKMIRLSDYADIPLPLGAIVASCTLVDIVPILEGTVELALDDPRPCIVPHGGTELSLWRSDDPEGEAIDDQRPYGDFTPGRYAWLLEDIKPTTERCPACWCVYGMEGQDRSVIDRSLSCGVCSNGWGKCDPIPAKGKQGLWTWSPV